MYSILDVASKELIKLQDVGFGNQYVIELEWVLGKEGIRT